ncbi:MAG: hypothetical protein V4436_01710 [Patescibacteria group bacterium]
MDVMQLAQAVLQPLQSVLQSLKVPTVLIGGFDLTVLCVLIFVVVFMLAFLALRGRGRGSKILTVVLVLLATPTLAVALVEQLSHPKELDLAWLKTLGPRGLLVYKSVSEAPVRVHIWIDIDGEPRAFYIPWSQSTEDSLGLAEEQNESAGGGDLRLSSKNFEASLDDQPPMFYAEPWPAPTPKEVEPETAPRNFKPEVGA